MRETHFSMQIILQISTAYIKNGIIDIKAAGYNGARTLLWNSEYCIFSKFLPCIKNIIYTHSCTNYRQDLFIFFNKYIFSSKVVECPHCHQKFPLIEMMKYHIKLLHPKTVSFFPHTLLFGSPVIFGTL